MNIFPPLFNMSNTDKINNRHILSIIDLVEKLPNATNLDCQIVVRLISSEVFPVSLVNLSY